MKSPWRFPCSVSAWRAKLHSFATQQGRTENKGEILRTSCQRKWILLQRVSHTPGGSGAKIGYARVSSREQMLETQLSRLVDADFEMFFEEKISGAKGRRPRLEAMLGQLLDF